MRNRIKFYIVILVVTALLQVINVRASQTDTEIGMDLDYRLELEEWNEIIANKTNEKEIKLQIDGKDVDSELCKVYINDNREPMVSASNFRELLQCSYRAYSDDKIVIEKGETKVVASVGSYSLYINDGYGRLNTSIKKMGGEIYIPVSLLEMCFGYTFSFDMASTQLSLINTKAAEKSIPSKYDYRTDGRLSSIKDQGNHSTCWAFASLAALESSLLPDKVADYSEKNMILNNGYVVSLMSGGDYTMATSYLAAWKGPIFEESETGYGKYETPTDILPDIHVQEIQFIDGKDLENIKKSVFLYGGVESSIYMAIDANHLNSSYYNQDTSAYCYIGTKRPNHDVVIIGWDDNYSKENFNFQPEGDGAFICQNSWGEGFGENGIFYVSYYDTNIGMHNVVYTGVESRDNYDNIYQSDICGFVGQLGYESENAYFANVYTAKSNEMLEAVSFYATGKNTEYEIYIVENFQDKSSFDGRVLLKKGSFENAGYYTVELDKSIGLKKGEKCAIVVKIKTPNAVKPIAIEYAAGYETSKVDISDGEGYISYLGREWERVEETKDCNICLKMFTTNVE